jgi:eukaryotic-like serine/threonine-protein kinase
VTGELQRNGDSVRLLMELKDSKSLRRLRSRTVEISESRIATLEGKVLEQASSMLQLHVPPEMLHQPSVDAAAQPGVYEFYEQGRGYLLHYPATLEDADRAIALLQKAIEKDTSFGLAYASLAYAYANKFHLTHDPQWIEKAKSLSQHALSLNDNLATAHLAFGLIQQDTGDQDTAIREFEKALQLDPTDDETLYNLSMAYDNTGRLLQAEALLKDALKRAPGSWVNYNYLGYLYYRHADYPQAEPLFRTATELAPDNPRAFYNLGGVYLAEGKYQEAEDILARGIAIRPTAGAYSNLALARQYQGHYEDAAVMFRKAAELLPGDDRLWCNLGVAYRLAGNRAKADEAFHAAVQLAEKTVALRPQEIQALGLLARYYAEAGEKTKAQQTLARAPASAQNDPDFLYDSALVYELAGRREQALAALHSALRAGYSLSQVQNAPEFAMLRQDPRYSAIAASSGS